MSEYRTILERARDQFPAPEMPLDGLLRRRDRKQRNRRLGTVVLALAVAAAAIGGLVRVFHLAEAARPASLPSTSDTWSRVVFDPGGRVNAISGGPAGLVAVGSEDDSRAAVWTSPDGRTWSRVSDLGPGDIRDVTAGGPGLVAVGTGDPVGLSVGAVWTSADGLTWQRAADDAFGGALLQAVTAGGPGVVAVGTTPDGPHAWYSSAGLTWEEASLPIPADLAPDADRASAFMFDVVHADDRLVAVGEVGISCGEGCGRPKRLMWTSTDGITWTEVRLPRSSMFRGMAQGADGLVAVGHYSETIGGELVEGMGVWTSVDGLSWTRVPSDQLAFTPLSQHPSDRGVFFGAWSVAAGSGGYVAVGTDGYCPGGPECPWAEAAVWASADGLTWVRVPPGPVFRNEEVGWVFARTVTAWGSRFVAAGEYGDRSAIWISEPSQGVTT